MKSFATSTGGVFPGRLLFCRLLWLSAPSLFDERRPLYYGIYARHVLGTYCTVLTHDIYQVLPALFPCVTDVCMRILALFLFFFFLSFVPVLFILLALLTPAPSLVVTQIRGDIVGDSSSSSPPHCGTRLGFFISRRAQFGALFPHRFPPNCACPPCADGTGQFPSADGTDARYAGAWPGEEKTCRFANEHRSPNWR